MIPWDSLEDRIRPFYPRAEQEGRLSGYPLPVHAAIPRILTVQRWISTTSATPSMEDHALASPECTVRRFVGLKLSRPLPDDDHHPQLSAISWKNTAAAVGFLLGGNQRPRALELPRAETTGRFIASWTPPYIEAPSSTHRTGRGNEDPEISPGWQEGEPVAFRDEVEHHRRWICRAPSIVHEHERNVWPTSNDVTEAAPSECTAVRRWLWGDAGYQGRTWGSGRRTS